MNRVDRVVLIHAALMVACAPAPNAGRASDDSGSPPDVAPSSPCSAAGALPPADLAAEHAWVRIPGDRALASMGFHLATGDFRGRGPQVAFSATTLSYGEEGFVGVLSLDEGVMTDAEVLYTGTGTATAGGFGFRLAASDLSADGATDLVVMSANHDGRGAPLLLRGPLDAVTQMPVPDAARLLQDSLAPFGAGAFALLGDWDGDGLEEVALGANNGTSPGSVMVFEGVPPDGGWAPNQAEVVIDDSRELLPTNLAFGRSLAAVDLDGDGHKELLVGDYSTSTVLGFTPADAVQGTPGWSLTNGTPGWSLGAIVLERNLSGQPTLVLPTPVDPTVFGDGASAPDGRVHFMPLPLERGTLDVGAVSEQLCAADEYDSMGSWVVSGDFDGDGLGDLAVGAPGYAYGGDAVGPGRVFLFRGPVQPTVQPVDAARILVGEHDLDMFGFSMAADDLDGDGIDDLVVGAPLHDSSAPAGGAVYVFRAPLDDGPIE